MPFLGLDVSNTNSPSVVAKAIAAVQFVIAKATEGLHYDDGLYPTYRGTVAITPGQRVFGGYHFAWPAQDPVAEAQHFLSYAGLRPGDLAALDMEKMDDGATWARRVFYALAWLDYVKANAHCIPILYINQYWRTQMWAAATADQRTRLLAYPLWLADYTRDPNVIGSASPWPAVTFEQWTDNDGGLDGDVYEGTFATLAALAVGGSGVTNTPSTTSTSTGVFMALTDAQQLQMFQNVNDLHDMMDAFKGGPEASWFMPFFVAADTQAATATDRSEGISGSGDESKNGADKVLAAVQQMGSVLQAAIAAGQVDPKAIAAALVAGTGDNLAHTVATESLSLLGQALTPPAPAPAPAPAAPATGA